MVAADSRHLWLWLFASAVVGQLLHSVRAESVAEALATFTDERKCSGVESESDECPGLDECVDCVPVDCSWNDWSQWVDQGGCSGIDIRSRSIKSQNNECGKPCEGPKQESKKVDPPARCVVKNEECVFSDWTEWSKCQSDLDQTHRSRAIKQRPIREGITCDGPLQETIPCGKVRSKDCEWAKWGEWTKCSADCDGGHRMKFRRVLNHAVFGGKPCSGDLQLTESCNTQPCAEDKDCTFEEWSEWTSCTPGKRQKYRDREIKDTRRGHGGPCAGPLQETVMCKQGKSVEDPCEVSEWKEWSECDKKCDGGQSYRSRSIKDAGDPHSRDCSNMSLHDVRPCNMHSCPEDSDCKLSEWSAWSKCSVECGDGVSKRHRKVESLAKAKGKGCEDDTVEVKGCRMGACQHRDCVWADWNPWSACSATCGGGSKQRDRHVKVAPLGDGKLCSPKDKEEVASCNEQSCGSCVDGEFLDWSDWTVCSATCGEGFRSRHRDIGTHPNYCGKPVAGLTDDYQTCRTNVACVESRDCELSAWSEWGDCSSSCSGVKERSRVVSVFATGEGKTCVGKSLKDVMPCASDSKKCQAPEPKPCKFTEWNDWEPCTATCDGGQRSRTRSILTPAQLGGAPCDGEVMMTEHCNRHIICDDTLPVDCIWGEWKDWSDCSRCGDQRYRHRQIEQHPNALGKICDAKDAKETGHCVSECHEVRYCTWGDWSSFGECSAMCGPSIKTRTRSLAPAKEADDYLFQGGSDIVCGGSQLDIAKCPSRDCSQHCDPVNAEFSSWSSWSQPSCTQLCERYRVVKSSAECGGLQAEGPLVETKPCAHKCNEAEDCEMSDWGEWSKCADQTSQRLRTRAVLRMAANDGLPCRGPLEQTDSCSAEAPDAEPCDLHEWGEWGECSVSCGTGFHTRQRRIKHSSAHGGKGCSGTMEEVRTCAMEEECTKNVDCKTGEWSAWSECDGSQQYRHRKMEEEAAGEGVPCNETLKELRPCRITVDCDTTEWSDWDACDKTCDAGQQQRQRQITTHPTPDGKQCPDVLMQTQGCSTEPCEKPPECELSEWTAWSACSATCGVASKTRSRFMKSAVVCNDPLLEVAECKENKECDYQDCVWHDWAEWSSCTCPCGGGHRSRNRHIKVSAEVGGKPCETSDKEQVEACNTQPCSTGPCIDGELGVWSAWEECSRTCQGGLTWRTRSILREANSCGIPVNGSTHETASCNSDVACVESKDCIFRDWSEWSSCTRDCEGVRTRSRGIHQDAAGDGKACAGDLKQTEPCHLPTDDGSNSHCHTKEAQDCILSSWEDWGGCSADCGGGQKSRVRSIKEAPANGGKSCDGPLEVVDACNTEACEVKCEPQDCVWDDWKEWSSCDKCGGQQLRHRHIKKHARCGGEECEPKASEESVGCKRVCHEVSYCEWSNWGDWGKCDKTCGKGTRVRKRHLASRSKLSDITKLQTDFTHAEVEALRAQTQGLEARHTQELVVAFASGGLSIFFAFAVIKAFRARAAPSEVGSSGSLSARNFALVE